MCRTSGWQLLCPLALLQQAGERREAFQLGSLCLQSSGTPPGSLSIAQASTLGMSRGAQPLHMPLGCGGSTPGHQGTVTKPYVSPFGPLAHSVPDKECPIHRQLCGEGGTLSKPGRKLCSLPMEVECSPSQNRPHHSHTDDFPCPFIRTSC